MGWTIPVIAGLGGILTGLGTIITTLASGHPDGTALTAGAGLIANGIGNLRSKPVNQHSTQSEVHAATVEAGK